MNSSSRNKTKSFTRESIIGLGEESIRKNYYPELQEKLLDLERVNTRNRAIIAAMPDLLLISDQKGHLTSYNYTNPDHTQVYEALMNNQPTLAYLKTKIVKTIEEGHTTPALFDLYLEEDLHSFEARMHVTEYKEVLLLLRDITEQKQLEYKLREAAENDSLTGLYNRRVFEAALKSKEHTFAKGFGLVLLDIDGLKLINDTLGHLAGDQMIQAMATLIKETFVNYGLTARIGGDEFGILLDGVSIQEIESLLYDLKEKVTAYNISHDTIKLTLSYGYSWSSDTLIQGAFMYQEADNNMYQDKLLKTGSTKHNTVKTLMKALEARDYITEGHAERMEGNALALGRLCGLTSKALNQLQLLAKFHDIGKVGIPDAILNKPDRLDDAEYKIMKTHCAIGERIAKESNELEEIAKLILMHHEKWDGRGYPLGLKGLDIPVECRILAIVDAYDAMTNDRPYRKALPHQVAIDEIKAFAGTQFDPDLVKTFIDLMTPSKDA